MTTHILKLVTMSVYGDDENDGDVDDDDDDNYVMLMITIMNIVYDWS